ncbi:tryptophan synthase beta subunit-like PLP-dependent enzyme [Thozetella sp. PMI_491]|nr:tryptophan synthase beta subunit-like PLP-dependent enzyme [Thozetella sp. PMI_491]
MGSVSPELPKPWIETPCVYSAPLSRAAGCNIHLKLENLQPSGSFKSRGVGNMMFRAVAEAPNANVHFYCSSGGNAGLACVTAAIALQRKATIVVPVITSEFMVGKLRALGAEVVQIGANWGEADKYLREELLANHDPTGKGVYVPPFDHPDIWTGHSTLVDEVLEQMGKDHGGKPVDAIVCNVGGGGLLNGIMEGLDRRKKLLGETKVLAIETVGADSLQYSIKAGSLATLPKITSIATSLGAPTVAAKTWEWVQTSGDSLICSTVTDADAVMGCARFLDDARILIEAACGATIATAYNGDLRRHLGKGLDDAQWAGMNVVLVVCGGSSISLEILNKYKEAYGVSV